MNKFVGAALLLLVPANSCYAFWWLSVVQRSRSVVSHDTPLFLDTMGFQPSSKRFNSFVNEPIAEWHERAVHLFSHPYERCDEADDDEDRDFQALYRTFETLFGLPRQVPKQHKAVLDYLKSRQNDQFRWEPDGSASISEDRCRWDFGRGKDLFIKGMGHFEVQATYERIVNHRRRLHKEEVLAFTMRELGKLPPELEELHPNTLLDTCDYDSTFHYVMKHFLDTELAKSIASNDVDRRHNVMAVQKRLMLEWVSEHHYSPYSLWGVSSLEGYPYWYVTIKDIWLAAYFPELLLESGVEGTQHNGTLHDALFQRWQARRFGDPNRRETLNRIAELLMTDGGELFSENYPEEPRKHFIKYLYKWKQQLGTLDELCMFLRPHCSQPDMQWPPDGMSLKPKQLLEYVRHQIEAKQSESQRFDLEYAPGRIELKQRRQFDHLYDLHDAPPNLKVLRTPRSISVVAEALQNCAEKYILDVQQQKCVLVAYYDPDMNKGKEEKPLALGMYNFDVSGSIVGSGSLDAAVGRWTQIYMARNKNPTSEVLEAYEKYTPTLTQWWRHHHS